MIRWFGRLLYNTTLCCHQVSNRGDILRKFGQKMNGGADIPSCMCITNAGVGSVRTLLCGLAMRWCKPQRQQLQQQLQQQLHMMP